MAETPQTRGFINDGHLFLTVLESGKSKIEAAVDPKAPLPGSQMTLLLHVLTW